MIGSGTIDTLAGSYAVTNSPSASSLNIERSGKGGVHVAISQTNQVGQQGVLGKISTAIAAWMQVNPDDDYYFSKWSRVTKVGNGGTIDELIVCDGGTTNYMFRAYNGGQLSGVGGSQYNLQASNQLGIQHRVVDSLVHSGAVPATYSGAYFDIWGASFAGAGAANKGESRITYRTYMEDRTRSGRTYAQVLAADQKLQAIAFAAGGRYYNDTFTAPLA